MDSCTDLNVSDKHPRKAHNIQVTLTELISAVKRFRETRGCIPRKLTEDASLYFGLPTGSINWRMLSTRFQRGYLGFPVGMSLEQFCILHGLQNKRSRGLQMENAKEVIQSFIEESSQTPNNSLGMTLRQYCVRQGWEPETFLGLTMENAEAAILKFFNERGRAPNQTSGDASKYFGLPDGSFSWMGLEKRLQKGAPGFPPRFSVALIKRKMQEEKKLPQNIIYRPTRKQA